ncbi:MAG: hypothetical protein AB1744_05255 [Candidatus Zixiibacteriota bacterium]
MSTSHDRRVGMIYLVRVFHTIVGLFFIGCIIYVYYCALTGRATREAYIAIGVLVFEGLIVFLSGRRCPLAFLHRRFGDERGFFDLFLPDPLVPFAYPTLAVVALFGIALLVM